jgi:cyclopropane fatty-acyl-phospholipid synthase-like methyltransferase
MPMRRARKMEYDHKEHPKTVDPKDYWGQVKRTVYGKPVSEEQIAMIVDALCQRLDLRVGGVDHMLDLGCGNGALASYFFDRVKTYQGVDFSEALIAIAKSDFERPDTHVFTLSDAEAYVARTETQPDRYNKVLCYGTFAYFKQEAAESILRNLHTRFPNVERVFIGNLPDLDRSHVFFKDRQPADGELTDFDSKIGIWRTKKQFSDMARAAGWGIEFTEMPSNFYAAGFRYDVTLYRT